MNTLSFLDELVKIGAARCLLKSAEINTVDIPQGMMGDGVVPPSITVAPSDASTRLPRTGLKPATFPSGHLGRSTEPKDPIDRFKYNRAYRDRR